LESPDAFKHASSAKPVELSSSSGTVYRKQANLEQTAKKRRTKPDWFKKQSSRKEAGSYKAAGLDTKGGVCKAGEKWCNIVFTENHFILPLHVFTGNKVPVDIYVLSKDKNGQSVELVYNYTFEEGKIMMHDLIAFRFRSKNGEMAPPSVSLKVPSEALKEVMVSSYVRYEDFLKRCYRLTTGVIKNRCVKDGHEMVYYTAETDFGMSGSMCLDENQYCVGFHNESGGFLPVTVSLLSQLRGSKN
jgi:hypothetical protein